MVNRQPLLYIWRLKSQTYWRIAMFILLGLMVTLFIRPTQAQDINDFVEMSVVAGYDSHFRENYWFPLQIRVRNDGDDITGQLIVRPETSGRVVSNAYSMPIDLPSGSEKTATLYIQARAFPPIITVELLDEEGFRVEEVDTGINSVDALDALYIIVAGALTDTVNLQSVGKATRFASQARWDVEQIPDNAIALQAVDMIMLSNIESTTLTIGQRTAIEQWVAMGGHLIVTGGPNWRSTTETIRDLLPLLPNETDSLENLNALASYMNVRSSDLSGRTIVTTGDVVEGASVLVATDDGLPLALRHEVGAGLVDFIAFDPTLEPFSSWRYVTAFWNEIVAMQPPQAGWVHGLQDYQEAAIATAILPGIELLPSVASLLLYLFAYIVLIGPVNYFVLSRINRRGWAWVTIPLLIVVFAGLAWSVGFNLRGNEVIVSRLQVVESWANNDNARLTQLVGVLSPRRETYSLDVPEDRMIRVMPAIEQQGILAQNLTQSTANISQSTTFTAQDFTIDGGIFANFNTQGIIDAPALSGSLSLSYNGDGTQTLQGAIRNDSDNITLTDAVIVAREATYELNSDFAPGDIVTIGSGNMTLTTETALPVASPIEYSFELERDSFFSAREFTRALANLGTVIDVLGYTPTVGNRPTVDNSPQAQELARREALLKAVLQDQYGSTARGNTAYLIGWSDEWDADISLGDTPWQDVATTLYVVELDVTVDTETAPDSVLIQRDQFTWWATERDLIEGQGLDDFILTVGGTGAWRFQPVEGSRLSEVTELHIFLDRGAGYGRQVDLSVWNWDFNDWESLGVGATESYVIPDPSRFIGRDNQVEIRLQTLSELGSVRIRELAVELVGSF